MDSAARLPRRSIGAGVGLSLLMLSTPFLGTAEATTVACGEIITQTTTLTSDVGPCSGDGIIIGADNITLDLGRHRVFGTPDKGDNAGILLNGRTGVTVTRGTVTDFGTGVVIMDGSANTVSRVFAHENIGPLDRSGDLGAGIDIFGSRDNLLTNNRIVHNGPFEGIGVFGASSTGNRIENNLVEFNVIVSFVGDSGFFNRDDGINLGSGLSGGSHTTIKNNVIRLNGTNGINACSGTGIPCVTTDNVIERNIVEQNGLLGNIDGHGINVVNILPTPGGSAPSSTRNRIQRNLVQNNASNGITLGLSLDNVIRNNRSVANGSFQFQGEVFDNNGIDLFDNEFDCDNNIWRGNVYETAVPECTTIGGQQQPESPPFEVPLRLFEDLVLQILGPQSANGATSAQVPQGATAGPSPSDLAALLDSSPSSVAEPQRQFPSR
jgi:hypothetical protein